MNFVKKYLFFWKNNSEYHKCHDMGVFTVQFPIYCDRCKRNAIPINGYHKTICSLCGHVLNEKVESLIA